MSFGVPACHLSRVWVVDGDGVPIMVVAVTKRAPRFSGSAVQST
jgi:hypothetical protein